MKTRTRRFAVSAGIALAGVLLTEAILRLAGHPDGRFRFTFVNEPGMYAAHGDFVASWGAFPYRIRTNSLGLRSHEPVEPKPKLRIVTIGDSITDGFFVDNDDTYPAQLERALAERGVTADVQNASRGQASIDKELGILRRVGLPLAPDVVVLTFVTNDIVELRGKTRAELEDGTLGFKPDGGAHRWFITRTALGEVLYDRTLRWKSPRYARQLDPAHLDRNSDYEDNARVFRRRADGGDGIILSSPFSTETEALVRVYLDLFRQFVARAHEGRAEVVFVYFPAYSQVYLDDDSFELRDRLRAECERLEVPFLDLTDALRRHGRERPLHFAPVDFHLNAAGNALFARTLAQFLVERGLAR